MLIKMKKHIAIIGASVGGLVAAGVLRSKGFDVTLLEKGEAIGGLYGKVETPFGKQELGMHVLYLSEQHYGYLSAIFGPESLHIWKGYKVDLGGAFNFGKVFLNSIYPDLRSHPDHRKIFSEIVESNSDSHNPVNALEAVTGRFGTVAGKQVFVPILEKLWKIEASQLSAGAIHCFYDLRRAVVCNEQQAESLKNDVWLDQVIANPDQTKPSGVVFNGRMAARFRNDCGDFSKKVISWLHQQNIKICFNSSVTIKANQLNYNDIPIFEQFDACIVASPLAAIIPDSKASMDSLDLSIYYFKLSDSIVDHLPVYYALCHDPNTMSSRIVNYDAYNIHDLTKCSRVIAVEVMHEVGHAPSKQRIESELKRILPFASVIESYKLPNSLRVPVPSVRNAAFLDKNTNLLISNSPKTPTFFTGMRTDKGVFFSHHTIGLAYDSAMECAARLS